MYADYKAYGYVTKATYDNISALRSQIQALKNAVKEYSILELKLSDVTNAYDEFEDAKTEIRKWRMATQWSKCLRPLAMDC